MWGFFCAIIKLQQRATSRHLRGQTRIPIYQGFCVTGKNNLTGKYLERTWSSQVELVGQRITIAPLNRTGVIVILQYEKMWITCG